MVTYRVEFIMQEQICLLGVISVWENGWGQTKGQRKESVGTQQVLPTLNIRCVQKIGNNFHMQKLKARFRYFAVGTCQRDGASSSGHWRDNKLVFWDFELKLYFLGTLTDRSDEERKVKHSIQKWIENVQPGADSFSGSNRHERNGSEAETRGKNPFS